MLTMNVKINIISLKGVFTLTSFYKIKDSFDCDEPIFTSDIEAMFPERSRPWIDKTIKLMIEEKLLRRFSSGVYYIPRKTLFGDSLLNPQKVISKKYIRDNNEIYGYFSGTALLNSLGLTTQVPNTPTIVSNKESSRGRRVSIGNQSVYVIKSDALITKENCAVLQFLEAIRLIDLSDLDKTRRDNLEKYIYDNNISLKAVSKYSSFFPDYVAAKLLGGNLIEKLTRQ